MITTARPVVGLYQKAPRVSSERRNLQAVSAPCAPRGAQRSLRIACTADADADSKLSFSRRDVMQAASVSSLISSLSVSALPALASTTEFCDEACLKALESVPMVTTPSGLQYKDIVVGSGPAVVAGYQLVVDYVGLVKFGKESGRGEGLAVFDSTLSRGQPADVRVTGDPETANVIPGLDEGLSTMNVGGIRRLYVPGSLAFPKGLPAAPGRPRVQANSSVVFDVKVLYIPGIEDEEEEEYDLADLVFEED